MLFRLVFVDNLKICIHNVVGALRWRCRIWRSLSVTGWLLVHLGGQFGQPLGRVLHAVGVVAFQVLFGRAQDIPNLSLLVGGKITLADRFFSLIDGGIQLVLGLHDFFAFGVFSGVQLRLLGHFFDFRL